MQRWFFLFALLPLSASAASYPIASCHLSKTQHGWAVNPPASKSMLPLIPPGAAVAGSGASQVDAYCNFLTATSTDGTALLNLHTATGTGLSFAAGCALHGSPLDVADSAPTLVQEGHFITLAFPHASVPSQVAAYLAPLSEARLPRWENKACDRIAHALNLQEFVPQE